MHPKTESGRREEDKKEGKEGRSGEGRQAGYHFPCSESLFSSSVKWGQSSLLCRIAATSVIADTQEVLMLFFFSLRVGGSGPSLLSISVGPRIPVLSDHGRRCCPAFWPSVPGKAFHCNFLGFGQILNLLAACSPPCRFVILMSQELGLVLAVGTSAWNIHELCCHSLMACLPFTG